MSANGIIVVDTNVWLDYFMGFRNLHDDAKRFIVEACRQDIPLVVPAHALKDVFFLVQQQLKAENKRDGKLGPQAAAECARRTAWAVIDCIMDMAAVGPSDQSDAWIASKQRSLHSDYEDNLVVACGMRLDARLLVTNNQSLIRHSAIPALDAKHAYELIAAG